MTASPSQSRLRELRCVWLAVPDPAREAQELARILGLEPRTHGVVTADMRVSYGLPPSAEGSVWVLLGPPGFERGMIGLVVGDARRSSKLLPRGWDSVEIVVRDVDGLADRLRSRPGCVAVAEPFTTDLSHLGGNVHRSGVWRMPWGTHLIATAGLTQPKTRRFPEAIGEAGPVFEVHLRTDRFEAARSLYVDALGMQVFMDSTFYEGPIHSAWGVPAGRRIEMQLLKGHFAGTGEGAIELQGHETAVLAAAPRADGGTSVVTYGVDGLEELCETLRERQFTLLASPCELEHGPFAPRRGAVVRGVEGERLQLVER